MSGDFIVLFIALAMFAFIPVCFRLVDWADRRSFEPAPSRSNGSSPIRGLLTLVLGSLTLIVGVTAALFGGTAWLSPLGSVGATVVVGMMFCALAALSVPPVQARQTPSAHGRAREPMRRAA